MDFFTAQDHARKNTFWLMVLFGMAVIALIVVTNLFLMFALNLTGADTLSVPSPEMGNSGFLETFSWNRFLSVGVLVVAVVLLGSLYRTWSLSKGGKSVAEMMGGTLVNSDTFEHSERQLLNIVEEISVASGVPVPLVFIMENEPGINAFAAGLTPGDAVIAVTRGTMNLLSRDELQGVIAHEFSHILNGDMRLNMRLIGILFGILMIGLIGRFMLRSGFYSSGRSRRDNSGIGLIALGAGLAVLGWVGMLFGNIIKATVSRQREYLADASAVQFTRNPDGIANALKKIGAVSRGSFIQHPDAAEFSHAYFSDGLLHKISSVFATHPPLDERILAIQPSWDGDFNLKQKQPPQAEPTAQEKEHMSKERVATYATVLAGTMQTINTAGNTSVENITAASKLINDLPPAVRNAVREPHDSRAVIFALLLDQDEHLATAQLKQIVDNTSAAILTSTLKLIDQVRVLEPRFRIPLIDMALPALRQLSPDQYQRFRTNITTLINADGKVSMFEWALQKIVIHNMDISYEKQPLRQRKYKHLKQLGDESSILLSFLSSVTPGADAQHAFRAAANELGTAIQITLRTDVSLKSLEAATDKLAQLKPLQKPLFLKACAACIAADDQVTANEMELLRALSSLLDCPLPPFPDGLPYTN